MISRRHALQMGGLTALGAAIPDAALRAFAPAPAPPRRLVVVSHCHGWPYESWRMRRPGRPADEPWTLDLGPLAAGDLSRPLAPLHPHRRRVLALDGLSLATAELDAGGNRHDRGWIHAWTGDNADFAARDTRSVSPSLDQLVAARIARPDRLPSLELSLDAALAAGRPISYNLGSLRLPAERSPLGAWNRVFGPASSGDAVGRRRRTTLDFARREYRELAPRFSAGERARLETHFGLVERLGHRLESLATLACEAPAQPAAEFERYDLRFDAFTDVIAAAFSCDITRVASLSLGEMPTAEFGADHISDKVHKGHRPLHPRGPREVRGDDRLRPPSRRTGRAAREHPRDDSRPGRTVGDGQHPHRLGLGARRRMARVLPLYVRCSSAGTGRSGRGATCTGRTRRRRRCGCRPGS